MTMPRASDHGDQCEWHHDQYSWECTCGAIQNPVQFKPKWLKASVGQTAETSEEKE